MHRMRLIQVTNASRLDHLTVSRLKSRRVRSDSGKDKRCVFESYIQESNWLTWLPNHQLTRSVNDMDSAICRNNVAHLANLKSKGGFFKGPLHLTPFKLAQIATFAGRGAVRILTSQLCKLLWGVIDLRLVALENLDRFFFGTRDIGL